jgi:hypothetical protein
MGTNGSCQTTPNKFGSRRGKKQMMVGVILIAKLTPAIT